MVRTDSVDGTRKSMMLHQTTYDRLARYGRFQESWEDIINRILDRLEECENRTKRRLAA